MGKPKQKPESPAAQTPAVCSKCWGVLQKGRGKRHICSKSQMETNVVNLSKKRSPKGLGWITQHLIKDIANKQGVSTRGGTVKLSTGTANDLSRKFGNPRRVEKKPKFTHKDLKRLQNRYKYSDAHIKGVARMVRMCAGRNFVEQYLPESVPAQKKKVDNFDEVKALDVKMKVNNNNSWSFDLVGTPHQFNVSM